MDTRPNRWLGTLALCMLLCAVGSTTSASLVAQYLFENNLNDNSGNGHTGAFLGGGGASFVVDPERGNVLDIDGTPVSGVDIYSTVPIPDAAANTSFTLSAWAKLRSGAASNTEEYILQVGRNGDNPLVTLGLSTDFTVRSYSETDLAGGNTDQVGIVSANPVETSAPFDEWHHVAVVYNRATDTATTYIDGLPNDVDDISLLSDVEAFSWSSTHTPGTSNAATIGTEGDLLGNSFNGLLDDIRFYDHALTDNEILVDVFAELRPIPSVVVNRNTGVISIQNAANATGTLDLQGYSITSTNGALDQAQWKSIADNYDQDSGATVDADDVWTVLSDPATFTDLSEFQFAGTPGDGASIAIGGSLDLSQGDRTWLPNPNENDLVAEVAYTDGTTEIIPVTYEGNGDLPLIRSDLNHDGSIDLADWLIFKSGDLVDLGSVSPVQAYLLGDLDGDLDTDIVDFSFFQLDYDAANGAGAFVAMLQSVPEPSSLLLLAFGGFAMLTTRHRRLRLPNRTLSILCLAIFGVLASDSQQAQADIHAAQIDVEGTTNEGTTATILNGTSNVFGTTGIKAADPESNFGDITLQQGPSGIPFSQSAGMIFANANQFQYNSVSDRNVIEIPGHLTNTPSAFSSGGMWLAGGRVSGGGTEGNFDMAFTHFPFQDGWIAGHVAEDGTFLAGNTAGVTVNKLGIGDGDGFFDLAIAGVNSLNDGMLFVMGAENSSSPNWAVAGPHVSDSTKFSVAIRDENDGYTTSEAGEWSFVYIPYDTPNLVAAGNVRLSGEDTFTTIATTGTWTVEGVDYGPDGSIIPPTETPDNIGDDGRFLFKIPKSGGGFYTDADGMFMSQTSRGLLSGGVESIDDNLTAWEYDASLGGFLVESYDMNGAVLQDSAIYFAFYEYDNPIESLDGPGKGLTALIHPVTGEVTLVNQGTDTLEFNSYQLDSLDASLKAGNLDWNSLDDQDFQSQGAGEGESWSEAAGSDTDSIGERFLLDKSTLLAGESVSIGNAFDTAGDINNLALAYGDALGGYLTMGDVEVAILGDMDGNGLLEEADINPFVEALTNRAAYEGNHPGVLADIMGDFDGNGKLDLGDVAMFKAAIQALPGLGASSAVPEPSTGLMLVLALLGFSATSSRKKRNS